MPHLAGGASNEPIFGEVGLNFWNKRRHEDNLKAHGGTQLCVAEKLAEKKVHHCVAGAVSTHHHL